VTLLESQSILDAALFESIFSKDIRTLGPAIAAAKETLLANGAGYAETSETFLLFGDPAMRLKIPIPGIPTGLTAQFQNDKVTLNWQGAMDYVGGAVSGYNVYRAATPRGESTKLNTELIAGTTYSVQHNQGETWYFAVTSVDGDGLESAASPAFIINMAFKGDINDDGYTDLADAIIALQIMTRMSDTAFVRPDYATSGADINGDNVIGIAEAVYILQKAGGLR
jgi:hypothetical protein